MIEIVVSSFWNPGPRRTAGINFSAKLLLEIAAMLLGASIGFTAVLAWRPALLAGIVLTVILAIGASYTISRLLGLSMLSPQGAEVQALGCESTPPDDRT